MRDLASTASLAFAVGMLGSCMLSEREVRHDNAECIVAINYQPNTETSQRTWDHVQLSGVYFLERQAEVFGAANFYSRGQGKLALAYRASCNAAERFAQTAIRDIADASPDEGVAEVLRSANNNWRTITPDEYSSTER